MPFNHKCSWCGDPLREDPSLYPDRHITSHGICDKCSFYLDGQKSRLSEFIASFDEPILVVDSEIQALDANAPALNLLAKSLESLDKKLGGEIIECIHSRSPEKCGRTEHCSGCALRMVITDTITTGYPHKNAKSFHVVMNPDNTTKKLTVYFSTEKVNNYILVTFEKIVEEGEKV
jgi:hypothetical protein